MPDLRKSPTAVGPGPRSGNFLELFSPPGDYAGGGGGHYFYTPANTTRFTAYGYVTAKTPEQGGHVAVDVRPKDLWHYWSLSITAPAGQDLVPGTYTSQLGTTNEPSLPLFDVSGSGGCDRRIATFTIFTFVANPDETVKSFSAKFSQSCETTQPALTGQIQYKAP